MAAVGEARRFNRLDDAAPVYETYRARAPHDLGVQLRLAAPAEIRPDKFKLALADTQNEIGRSGSNLLSSLLDEDPSNAFAQDVLTKIAHAATAPDLAQPTPSVAGGGVRRVNVRIAAAGASAASVMETARSVRCASSMAWSVSTTDQVIDWALKTAGRPEALAHADTPTLE